MEATPKKKRVLIVEDEPLIGAAVEELLIDGNYDVAGIIDSVDDLIPAVVDYPPDLVLMDVKLKSYNDGVDAARRLRLITEAPIIFLTAYTDEATRARTERISNTVFLGKPLDEERLLKEIARLLE